MDPDMNMAEKRNQMGMIAMLHTKTECPTIIGGDFNIQGLHSYVAKGEQCCAFQYAGLVIPYVAGTPTNFTTIGGRVIATEIDYILVSKNLKSIGHTILPGPSTHCCLVEDLECPQGVGNYKTNKRYKWSIVQEATKTKVCVILTLFWFWLRTQGADPD
jgi:hypothetical protein